MCCSRSLFWRSSWWTRAWASSRAVASALSWSFKRWTCNRRCEGSRVCWQAGRKGFSVMSEANLIQLTETFFPRLLLLSEFPKQNNAPHPSLCEDQGQTVLTLPTHFSHLRNQRCVLFAANISLMATRKYKKFIYMLWMGPCCSFSEANDVTQGCCHSNASAFFSFFFKKMSKQFSRSEKSNDSQRKRLRDLTSQRERNKMLMHLLPPTQKPLSLSSTRKLESVKHHEGNSLRDRVDRFLSASECAVTASIKHDIWL